MNGRWISRNGKSQSDRLLEEPFASNFPEDTMRQVIIAEDGLRHEAIVTWLDELAVP